MALEQDERIAEVVTREHSRLRSFIRRRVPDPRDAEDILQDVFYELVEANRLLMPIHQVTGWLFRVARNRITDLFRKRTPERFSDAAVAHEDDDLLRLEDLLPSPDAGPEALYERHVLLDELESAIGELPPRGVRRVRTRGAHLQGDGGGNRREREHPALAQALCGAASARAVEEHL
jgi:RNA polymerase sigma factor (sigma-70 family)